MPLRINNTLGREREDFIPLSPGRATVYACGVTTYDLCHIGHGRAAVVFDVAVRHLRHRGYDVTFVRNYTDVDDKIINRAAREGMDPAALSDRYVLAAQEDMLALGCLPPDVEPRVTTHIPQIVRFIEGLVEAGKAYAATNGDVYYDVQSFEGYGKLSGKKVDDLVAGARCDVIEEKRSPVDFALWKAAKPGEPAWPSPWGDGRPGWHIECSAMCAEHLGETIDIHAGGSDLIFPHHENEIAQSEGLFHKPLARYWMHNGMITVDREKMSKSIGNVLNIQSVLQRYHREAVRLFYLSTHYRSPIDYSARSLEEAEAALERLYMAVDLAARAAGADADAARLLTGADVSTASGLAAALDTALARIPAKGLTKGEAAVAEICRTALQRFEEGLDDDFNTARGLSVLFEVAREVRRYAAAHKRGTPNGAAVLLPATLLFRGLGPSRLGLLEMDAATFQADLNRRRLQCRSIAAEEIDRLIEARAQARAERQWSEADRVRDLLKAHGISLEDSPGGTVWRVDPLVEVEGD